MGDTPIDPCERRSQSADDDDSSYLSLPHSSYNFERHDEGLYCWDGEAVAGTVWGDGPYTANSNIVLAALHCGAVSRTKVGRQLFRVRRRHDLILTYVASEHFGVQSKVSGYHQHGAITIEGVHRVLDVLRPAQHLLHETIGPRLPDVGSDLLFDSIALPPPTENSRASSLIYVDNKRLASKLDESTEDTETTSFQLWFTFMERVRILVEAAGNDAPEVMLFRLTWAASAIGKSAAEVDVSTDVVVEQARTIDKVKLLLTFLVGAALVCVPFVDVGTDLATTAQFWLDGSDWWFTLSMAIFVNSARFVTAFHVMDPEPNLRNLLITFLPLAHIVRLPFILEKDVNRKDKDSTQTLQRQFSARNVGADLLTDADHEQPRVIRAEERNALFSQMSLPADFAMSMMEDNAAFADSQYGRPMPFDDDHTLLSDAAHFPSMPLTTVVSPRGAAESDDAHAKYRPTLLLGEGWADDPTSSNLLNATNPNKSSSASPTHKKKTLDDASHKTFQDAILNPFRRVYNKYVKVHSGAVWLRPVWGVLFEAYLLVFSGPTMLLVLLCNAIEVIYALLQQRFLGRGGSEPDDIIQKRKQQHTVLSFAEAISETLPQLCIQMRAYSIGTLNPLLFGLSSAVTLLSVLKNIFTFILEFEDILQLGDPQKILQRSLAEDVEQPDVWLLLSHYPKSVVLGKEHNPCTCNMEAAVQWCQLFLKLRQADEQVTQLRGRQYTTPECFVNAARSWCRAMTLRSPLVTPYAVPKDRRKYKELMARGWRAIAEHPIELVAPYVDGEWFSPDECYAVSLGLNEADPETWLRFGTAGGGHYNHVDYSPQNCFEEALNRHTELSEAYYELGRVMSDDMPVVLLAGKVLTRRICFCEAFRLNSQCWAALVELGRLVETDERVEIDGNAMGKLECFKTALSINPKCAAAWYEVALCLTPNTCEVVDAATKQPLGRRECLSRAVELDEEIGLAWLSLAEEHERAGSAEAAEYRACVIKAVQHNVRSSKAFFRLGELVAPGETEVISDSERFTKFDCYVNSLLADPEHPIAMCFYRLACSDSMNAPGATTSIGGKRMSKKDLLLSAVNADLDFAEAYIDLGEVFAKEGGSAVLTSGRSIDETACYAECVRIGRALEMPLRRLAHLIPPSEPITLSDGTHLSRQDCLLRLIDIKHEVSFAYTELGALLSTTRTPHIVIGGQSLTSTELFVRAIEADKHNTTVYLHLARCLKDSQTVNKLGKLECYELLLQKAFAQPAAVYCEIAACMGNRKIHLYEQKDLYGLAVDADGDSGVAYSELSRLLSDDETLVLSSGRQLRKLDCFLEMVSLDYETAAAFYGVGMQLMPLESATLRDGAVVSRRQCFLEAIARDVSFANAYAALSLTIAEDESVQLLDGRRSFSAKDCCLEALFLDSQCALAFYGLGRLMSRSERMENVNGSPTALGKCDYLIEALRLHPQMADAYGELGLCLLSSETVQLFGRPLGALDCLKSAVALGTRVSTVYLALAEHIPQVQSLKLDTPVSRGVGSISKLECISNALLYDPRSAEAYYQLACLVDTSDETATVHLHGKRMTRKECLLKAVELNSNHAAAYAALSDAMKSHDAVVTLSGGATMTQRDTYLHAISLDAMNTAALKGLVASMKRDEVVTLKSGQVMSRVDVLVRILEINARDGEAFEWLGEALRPSASVTVCGRRVSSIECYASACELSSEQKKTRDLFLVIASLLGPDGKVSITHKGRVEQLTSRDCCVAAIALDTEYALAYATLASVMTRDVPFPVGTKKEIHQRQACLYALEKDPKCKLALVVLARFWKPSDPHIQLAGSKKKLNQRGCLVKAIEIDPEYTDAYIVLGRALGEKDTETLHDGDVVSQRDCFTTAAELDEASCAAWLALGCSMHSATDSVEIHSRRKYQWQCFVKAIAAEPASPHAYYHLGVSMESYAVSQKSTKQRTQVVVLDDGSKVTSEVCFVNAINIFGARGALLDPLYCLAYYRLGLCLKPPKTATLANGAVLDQDECFCEAIRRNPHFSEPYYELGNILSERPAGSVIKGLLLGGKPPSVADLYTYAIQYNKKWGAPYARLGRMMGAAETVRLPDNSTKLTKRECLVQAVVADPDSSLSYMCLGSVLSHSEAPVLEIRGQKVKMSRKECFTRAVACDPRNKPAYEQLAYCLNDGEKITLFDKSYTRATLLDYAARHD